MKRGQMSEQTRPDYMEDEPTNIVDRLNQAMRDGAEEIMKLRREKYALKIANAAQAAQIAALREMLSKLVNGWQSDMTVAKDYDGLVWDARSLLDEQAGFECNKSGPSPCPCCGEGVLLPLRLHTCTVCKAEIGTREDMRANKEAMQAHREGHDSGASQPLRSPALSLTPDNELYLSWVAPDGSRFSIRFCADGDLSWAVVGPKARMPRGIDSGRFTPPKEVARLKALDDETETPERRG